MGSFYRKPLILISFLNVYFDKSNAAYCGCKIVRPCYKNMVDTLKEGDEAMCIEDASIGASTVSIFLKAIELHCGSIVRVINNKVTYEGRHLNEVHVYALKNDNNTANTDDRRPMILIDAGQEAGTMPVSFALYVIQQLVSCEENNDMIQRVRWVILPSTNPDGQEYSRSNNVAWRKNLRPIAGKSGGRHRMGHGVDISRNFPGDWNECPPVNNEFSPIYPGEAHSSENETLFIKGVLDEYAKNNMQAYLSIRRDGHSINYPYAFSAAELANKEKQMAAAIAARVNQRAGGVHLFTNQSIFELNGKPRCGHSVDYASRTLRIELALEMHVFIGAKSRILSRFQTLPRGYQATLRSGYFSGIKELYSYVSKIRA